MQQQIQIAWSTPKSPDFDVREFASRVLAIAKENLQRDGELVSTAFIITEDLIQCASIQFSGHEEKVAIYESLVKFARVEHALAVITCNDAFVSKNAGPEEVEAYYPGKLCRVFIIDVVRLRKDLVLTNYFVRSPSVWP